MKTNILFIILVALFSSCLRDKSFKLVYEGFEPKQINDDWTLSTPENENVDRAILEKAYQLIYQDDRYLMARSLLVFRNGKLIAEAYPDNTNDINEAYNIQSCTKSITSILTGIAIHDKKLDSLNEPLHAIYPQYFDSELQKRTITLQDALVMQTGLEFDNSKHTQQLYQTTDNSVGYILSQPRLYNSGTITNYNDGAPHLVSKAIEVKVGKSLREYAAETLFSRLQIIDWKWEASKDGTTFGAFSLYLKPRDFGKIGQLLVQNGKWGNDQIIDSTYLADATKIQTAANFNSEPYGYYFWILPAFNGYCALGHGGQFLLIVPDKQLVVVYTSWPYTNDMFFDQRNVLMDIVVESCQ